jgi:hypothetical protein
MECDKNMSFEDCELAVLRSAVDKIEKQTGRKKIENPEVKEIINIVENFLKKPKEYVMVEQQLIIYYQLMTNFMINL